MLFAEGRFSRFDDDTDDHETTFISRLGGLNYWVNNLPITYFYFCLKKLHFKSSEPKLKDSECFLHYLEKAIMSLHSGIIIKKLVQFKKLIFIENFFSNRADPDVVNNALIG